MVIISAFTLTSLNNAPYTEEIDLDVPAIRSKVKPPQRESRAARPHKTTDEPSHCGSREMAFSEQIGRFLHHQPLASSALALGESHKQSGIRRRPPPPGWSHSGASEAGGVKVRNADSKSYV